MGRQKTSYDTDEGTVKRRSSETISNGGGDSDGRRSLDLASSHSSDDDETVTNRSLSLNRNSKEHRKPELPSKPSFMPNISEAGEPSVAPMQMPSPTTPPHNMMPMSTSNIRPLYSPAWSSQLPPPAYPLPMTYGSAGRWMAERLSTSATASDNEQHMGQHQPLPHRHQRQPHYGAEEDDSMDDRYNPSDDETRMHQGSINNLSYGTAIDKSLSANNLEMTDSEYV